MQPDDENVILGNQFSTIFRFIDIPDEKDLLGHLSVVPAKKGLWQPLISEFFSVFPGALYAAAQMLAAGCSCLAASEVQPCWQCLGCPRKQGCSFPKDGANLWAVIFIPPNGTSVPFWKRMRNENGPRSDSFVLHYLPGACKANQVFPDVGRRCVRLSSWFCYPRLISWTFNSIPAVWQGSSYLAFARLNIIASWVLAVPVEWFLNLVLKLLSGST